MYGMTEGLQIKRITDTSRLPTRGSEHSAGLDLYCDENRVLCGRSVTVLSTGIAVAIPYGFYGRIAPRSSLAKRMIDVGAGVIDCDYRGEVKVVLYNLSDEQIIIARGDRIAQLVVEKIGMFEPVEVTELYDTKRV